MQMRYVWICRPQTIFRLVGKHHLAAKTEAHLSLTQQQLCQLGNLIR